MKRMSKELTSRLAALDRMSEFQYFKEWLVDSLLDSREANDTLKDEELYWSQGEAQTLAKILKALGNAEEYSRRFKEQER